jgi:replicative DNA helicase
VALSQLNRGPEQRADKKPLLADLRESGNLEQDSDLVLLLHRPDMVNPDDRPGEADIHLAKHRNGPLKVCPIAAPLALSRFANLADDNYGENLRYFRRKC